MAVYPRLGICVLVACLLHGLFADPTFNLETVNVNPKYINLHMDVKLICRVHNLDANAFEQDGAIAFERSIDDRDEKTRLATYNTNGTFTESDHFAINGIKYATFYEFSLEIIDFTNDDIGGYRCGVLESEQWRYGSDPLKLTLMKIAPVDYPMCSSQIKDDHVRVVLKCKAKDVIPQPKITWFKGNVTQSSDVNEMYGAYHNELTINISDLDEPFVCKYSYFDGVINDNRSCWIGKPKIEVTAEGYQPYTTGDDVEIRVIAFAHPSMTKPMKCRWDYTNGDNLRMLYIDNTMVKLMFTDVQPIMNGTVVNCTGGNSLGSTTALFILLVEDFIEDNLTASVTTDKVHLVVGQSTIFTCDVGFIPPVHHVNYNWYFEEQPQVDVRDFWWKERYNQTDNKNQLTLTSASLDDNGKVLTCRVHYSGRTILSSKTKIIVGDSAESCQHDFRISMIKGAAFAVVVLVCCFIMYKVISCIVARLQNTSNKVTMEHIGDDIRTSSFASSASESQSENSNQMVNISDRSGILKRSSSLPASSRGLPSIPPISTLPPLHEYEKTPRNETYSTIKSQTKESELSHQAYMDMAAGNTKNDLVSPNNLVITVPSTTACNGDVAGGGIVQCPSRETASLNGDVASAEEWYLEAKKTPYMTVQYHDLEDLYRETAKNNVYSPQEK